MSSFIKKIRDDSPVCPSCSVRITVEHGSSLLLEVSSTSTFHPKFFNTLVLILPSSVITPLLLRFLIQFLNTTNLLTFFLSFLLRNTYKESLDLMNSLVDAFGCKWTLTPVKLIFFLKIMIPTLITQFCINTQNFFGNIV